MLFILIAVVLTMILEDRVINCIPTSNVEEYAKNIFCQLKKSANKSLNKPTPIFAYPVYYPLYFHVPIYMPSVYFLG